MKNILPSLCLSICCTWLVSSGSIPTDAAQPKTSSIKEMVNGDSGCHLTLVDETGTTLDVCKPETFVNKKVRLFHGIASVHDCQSVEPCGKTKKESLITKIEILGGKPPTKPSAGNTEILSNGKWKITVSNRDSWSGVNNTGDLTYYGCDPQGKCIRLIGGRVNCRDGICSTGWSNKGFLYTLEEPITENGYTPATLIVKKDSKLVLKVTGLKNI